MDPRSTCRNPRRRRLELRYDYGLYMGQACQVSTPGTSTGTQLLFQKSDSCVRMDVAQVRGRSALADGTYEKR